MTDCKSAVTVLLLAYVGRITIDVPLRFRVSELFNADRERKTFPELSRLAQSMLLVRRN
jgi:hypothetical protein